MHLPVPGPRHVVEMVERGAEAVEQLWSAVPRLVSLLDDAEHLLARVADLVERIEGTRASADELVQRTDGVVTQAQDALASAAPLIDRMVPLLDQLEPPLVRLQPTLQRLAETTDPREVDALVALIDQLPVIAAKMDTDIIPVLDSLSTVAPDVHDLLDVTRELNEMLASVPGLGRIKKRIDEEQAAEGRG